MNHINFNNQSEQGRSMVEMLGTLAIIGVLSAGAIGGYSYAMNKHRTNELIYEATKRAQWVGTQLEMNNPNPSLNTFGTDSFGGGTFTGEVVQLENGQIGIKVADLKEAVCQNILNSIGDNTVIRDMKDVNCNDDNGTATLVFNRDLSTSDPTEIPEVSGEVSAQASTEAPTTQDPDEVLCSGNGSWNGSSCTCDSGYGGADCSQDLRAPCNNNGNWLGSMCDCDLGWGGTDCSVDTSIACGDHGHWYQNSNGTGFCDCDTGYYGEPCVSQNPRAACNNNGTWQFNSIICGYACVCDTGWGGTTCTVENPCVQGTWFNMLNGGGFCNCGVSYMPTVCPELEETAEETTTLPETTEP